jgi:DNA uptake protein ComE-like DNA-binding protein
MIKEFSVGFALGAGMAVLLAPDSGQSIRRKLRSEGERVFGIDTEDAHVPGPGVGDAGAHESGDAVPVAASTPATEYAHDQSVTEVLNHARKSELTSVEGIGDVTAKRIIRHRPYTSAEEAIREEVIPESTLEKVKEQLIEGKADEETAA